MSETLKPCPFCGVMLEHEGPAMVHPSDYESDFDCPLDGMSWRLAYYERAWNTRKETQQ